MSEHVPFSLGVTFSTPPVEWDIETLLEWSEARTRWSERSWLRRVWDAAVGTREPPRLTRREVMRVSNHRMKLASKRTLEAIAEQYLRDAPGEIR